MSPDPLLVYLSRWRASGYPPPPGPDKPGRLALLRRIARNLKEKP